MTATATLPTDAALNSGGQHVGGATPWWNADIGKGNGPLTVLPFARAAPDAVAA
jgi:hypothetical protein